MSHDRDPESFPAPGDAESGTAPSFAPPPAPGGWPVPMPLPPPPFSAIASSAANPEYAAYEQTATQRTSSVLSDEGTTIPARRVSKCVDITLPRTEPGKPVVYRVVASNRRNKPLLDMRVEHELPEGARLVAADPKPSIEGRILTWLLGDVPAGRRHPIDVTIRPLRGAPPLPVVTPFEISFSMEPANRAPRLELTVSAPAGAPRGKRVPFCLKIQNVGTGPASDVAIRGRFVQGVAAADASFRETIFPVLAPGQSEVFAIDASADSGDCLAVLVDAGCREGCAIRLETAVPLMEALLELSVRGPEKVSAGQQVEYEIVLANSGNAPARDVLVVATLPEELRFPSAASDGVYDPDSRQVVWQFDTLAPVDTRSLVLQATAELPCDTRLAIEAQAEPALQARAEQTLTVLIDESERGNLLDRLLAEVEREMEAAPRARKAATPSGLLASFVEEGERYLIFTLAGIDYAIPAAQVLEVGRPPRVTPLPNVPEWLTGLTNVRGDIVSVVDLRGFLGLGTAGLGTSNRLVIVKATDEDVTTGLLVDRVRGIRRFPVTSFQQLDAIEDARIGPHVQGINEQDGSLLVSLDLNRMLRSREMRQFELA